jgi:uncharacterized protein YcfL
MKNVLVLGVAALALVGCGAKEEAAVEAAPAVEAPAEAPAAEATPAPEAAPAEGDKAPEGVDGGKAAIP